MDRTSNPDRYWHCQVQLKNEGWSSYALNYTHSDLKRTIVDPWKAGERFTVNGTIIDPKIGVRLIKIVHTRNSAKDTIDRYKEKKAQEGVAIKSYKTNELLFKLGKDLTNDILFTPVENAEGNAEALVVNVCERLPQAASRLANRRKGKTPFVITDEYDVQDLLHAVLRSSLKHTVQENPLPKVANAKSAKMDIGIEKLGILIEVKYAREPSDQAKIVQEIAEDLLLYTTWKPLKVLIFLIYNATALHDAEALHELNGERVTSGLRFMTRIILA